MRRYTDKQVIWIVDVYALEVKQEDEQDLNR